MDENIDVENEGIVSCYQWWWWWKRTTRAHASRKNDNDFPRREQGRGEGVVVWHTSHPCEWPSGARPPNNRYMRSKWPPETPPTLLYPSTPRNHHVLTPPRHPHTPALFPHPSHVCPRSSLTSGPSHWLPTRQYHSLAHPLCLSTLFPPPPPPLLPSLVTPYLRVTHIDLSPSLSLSLSEGVFRPNVSKGWVSVEKKKKERKRKKVSWGA